MFKSWKDTSCKSTNSIPLSLTEEMIYIMHSKLYSWRGAIAYHSWVSVVTDSYTNYEIIDNEDLAKHLNIDCIENPNNLTFKNNRTADNLWFGNYPIVGFKYHAADKSIGERLEHNFKEYPYKEKYRSIPGPNSNSYVSYLIRNISELNYTLPLKALGRNFDKF